MHSAHVNKKRGVDYFHSSLFCKGSFMQRGASPNATLSKETPPTKAILFLGYATQSSTKPETQPNTRD